MPDPSQVRAALEEEERRLMRRAEKIESDLRKPSNPDWQERATETENDEVLEGLDERTLARLAEIRGALRRLRDGTWTRCERCGGDIDARRLEALPTSTTCVACAG